MRMFNIGILIVMITVLVFGLLAIVAMSTMDGRSETPALQEKTVKMMSHPEIFTVTPWTIVPHDAGILEATSVNYDDERCGNQTDLYFATTKTHDLRFLAWTGSLRPGVRHHWDTSVDLIAYCTQYLRHGKGVRGTTILLKGRLKPAQRL